MLVILYYKPTMPELPEVQTTVNGLNATVKGKSIVDVWSSYNSPHHKGKLNIKDVAYFKSFRKTIIGKKILRAERMGKNILIYLSHDLVMLIHMKMTGHLLYGPYELKNGSWKATGKGPLRDDPYNSHVRLVFTLSNKKHLAFSDLRKFAKVFVFEKKDIEKIEDIKKLGPDPFKNLALKDFEHQILKRRTGKIKQVLLDQEIIAGIGNIYSDEMLWLSGVHPFSIVSKIPEANIKKMYSAMMKVLENGIKFGGDSMSDYRNIYGEFGNFQNKHNVYRKTKTVCSKKNCGGTIERRKIGGRSAHFCNRHQTLFI